MARTGRWGVGLLLILLLAGCSGCSSGQNLAQDQAVVDRAQAAVNADQAALTQARAAYQNDADTPAELACSLQQPQPGAAGCPGNPQQAADQTAINKDQAKLERDQFKLQVAQDQLKRDEGG